MALDRRLARELAPFGAATLLGFAIVAIGERIDWALFAVAAALMVALALTSLLAPWRTLPRSLRIAPWLVYLVALAILRAAGDGTVAGVGALSLVPVFWLAVHGTRGHLVVVILGVCAFFIGSAVMGGSQEQSVSIWRIAVMFGTAAALVGFAVQHLVGRVRAHADALELRERDLEIVADLSRSLSLAKDARQRICAAACNISAAQFAVLLEVEPDGTLAATAGAGMGIPAGTFTSADGPAWALTAFASREATFVTDVPELEGAGRPAAILFEPVHRGEEVAGVLVAGWHEPPTDERRARSLVRLLASEAAVVIERADLLARLTETALTDELTGLPNRRAWDERLALALGGPEPVCVAILDLDFFKAYNDDHGHQAGDLLLREAAAAWRTQLRPSDTLARYGGEEFVVLLHEGDVEVALGVVDRLRSATPRGQSCSAGLARREPGESADALLGRADEALYDAKRAGRDRSLVAGLRVA